ncbi:MAG TPA: adenylate/guanylate cyclase domain-containing protein, partial [Gammaproteobacteria bacterium]|nr:adenylate/guanylate cyclase domain-containing protein [Gammaproteobacteria bacterium]
MGAINKSSFINIRLGLLAAAAIFAVLEFSVLHSLRPLTHFVQDFWVRSEAAASRYDQDILLVNIDERSLVEMAPLVGRWPWPRSVYAVLLEGILPHDPKAVVFDILVSDRHVEHPESDLYFVKTAVKDERVFMPLVRLPVEDGSKNVGLPLAKYADEMGFIRTEQAEPDAHAAVILPLGKLATTGRTGAINFLADSDGMGRRYPLYQAVQGWRIPSLPMRVALNLSFALPENAAFTLNWGGTEPYKRPAVSFVDMYRAANGRESPLLESVEGKIVILGSTAPQLHDSLPTPFSGTHPGVDILATAIANLKNGNWLQTPPDWSNWLATALLLAVLAYLLKRSKGVLLAGGLLLVLTPTLAMAGLAAARSGWLIGGIAPLAIGWGYYLATGGYAFIQERRSRLHAVRTFGRFLDPRVVAELVKNENALPDLKGRSAQVTVLFSDIRGFTTLSESRPPEEIVALLNDYFSRQVAIIFKYGGT